MAEEVTDPIVANYLKTALPALKPMVAHFRHFHPTPVEIKSARRIAATHYGIDIKIPIHP
ncbi:hypothetical protein CAI21_00255 [Alkalilimnicola ehrlichii]|uniref:Uncharacterized protein n=1 Tax=Alkalilimnicola ehrlichii TaxID=351052 RepID=A0A3E0X406_9GAMM|nr:hypothetical protein CAI21_00255 [Alkalilimnicola ehrlichii]RFA39582.1 hypothetical protein CAL65_02150 [Alkalilimnicola ehrlichii]